jgi:tryptophan synthase beta subunit
MGGSFAENIIDVEKETSEKVFNDPIFQQELDVTVFKYINGSTTDDVAFQSEIEELINGNAELRAYMKRNNITHLGTNIIQQAKAEKAERSYYGETIQIINDYITNGISNKPQEYEIKIRAALEKFMKEQNKLPDMVKSL